MQKSAKSKKKPSNIARGDMSRAGIIIHSLALLRALLECGYYSREGLYHKQIICFTY